MPITRPPGPRTIPFVGALPRLIKDPLEYLVWQHRDYGDLVYSPMMGIDYYQISDPDHIETILRKEHASVRKDRYTQVLERALGQGLVTSHGEFWKRQRRLVSFAFTPKRIRGYGEAMVEQANRVLDQWVPGSAIDIHAEMARMTLAIIGKTIFDADVLGSARDVGKAMDAMSEFFANSPESLMNLPYWVPTPRNRRFGRALRAVDRLLYEIIEDRRRSSHDRGDFLSAILFAEGEDGGTMNAKELRDECITLFAAGHETTAIALTYCLYLLSKHPEIGSKVYSEIESVVGNRRATADDMQRLSYTTAVLKETMRIYPPVWTIGREVVDAIEVGGYILPRGAQLIIPQWIVHRNPRVYPNPEAFVPERFLGDSEKKIPKGAYLPFGDGPRICIGNHFAIMEGVLLLATMLQRFELELLPGERVEFSPSVTLRPKRGPRMRIKPRRDRRTADQTIAMF